MVDSNNNSDNAKRQAMTGQWRTPPLPAFAAQNQSQHQQHHQHPNQHHQQHPHQHHQQQHQQHQQHHQHHQHHTLQQHQHQQHQNTQSHQQPQMHTMPQPAHNSIPVAMPPIPSNPLEEIPLPESTDDYAKALQEAYRRGAEAAARLQQSQQMSASCPNLQQFQGQPNDPTLVNALVPNPLAGPVPLQATPPVQQPPPPPQQLPVQHHQQQQQQQQPLPQPAGSRSLSLPDMQSYAARAQAEEEKRKKRLARNRASARLRRLRKKNLVDSYEGEVGVLEASLQKLKAHTWGTSHEALLEALSMERGQQELSNEERVQLIQDIVQQQRKQVEFLRETQREQEVLLAVVENPDDEISRELQSILNLTDDQKENIRNACHGLEKEVQAMETFIQCLDAMQDKTWLWNEGVAQIANQFTSILHTNQLSKFLLWADGNAEALDSLEYCHAPPSQAPPANTPIFVFGMDDHASQGGPGQGDE